MSTILISGATGKVGGALAHELIARKADVTAIVRNSEKGNLLSAQGIHVTIADFNDVESLNEAFKIQPEKAFLVFPPSEEMAILEKRFIQIAHKSGLQHLVYLSMIGTHPNHQTSLGKWHAEVEEYLKSTGMNFTILRPHSFMQNLLANTYSVKEDNTLYSSLGSAKIPMIDCRDIGSIAAEILTRDDSAHAQKTYNLTGPEAISYEKISFQLEEIIGREVTYQPIPAEAAKQAMINVGLPEWLAFDLVALNSEWSEGKYNEVDPIAAEIKGSSLRTVREFLQEHAHFFS